MSGPLSRRDIRLAARSIMPVAFAILIMMFQSVSAGQQASGRATSAGSSNSTSPTKLEVTVEQQKTVQDFVRQNHPELNVLLAYLEQNRPQEYKRAIRDLYRNIARIETLRERDQERYELELKLWQLQSRSQLVAARLTMLDEQQRQEELRQLLRQQAEIRAELLRRERDRLKERLSKLEQQISQLEDKPDELVEKELQALLRATRAASSGGKKSGNVPVRAKNGDTSKRAAQ